MTTPIDSAPGRPAPTTPEPARADSLMHRLTVKLGGFGRPLAGKRWFRLYGLLRHVGRTSGKAYEIPIVALPFPGGFMIPLPFGEGTQWLKNIEAADQAGLRHAGHDYVIDQPEVVDLATAKPDLPGWVRFAAGRAGIEHFVRVRQVSRA
jgi:deazaflavin-dependent oxidoreductase (nitroreductase family)